MAERASLTDLIDFVARMVNDPGHDAHSRDDVGAALDVYRLEARYEALTPLATLSAVGTSHLTFVAAVGYWETDGTLFDGSLVVLSPTTADWTAGRWSVAAEPSHPVTILGWYHDPYLAAADLLEVRAAQLAEAYNFKTGPDNYLRSQRYRQLLEQAARYRAMSPRSKAKADAVHEWVMPEVAIDVLCY